MPDRQTIYYLKLIHGSYNSVMMLLFFYQGFLGLRIRKQRQAGIRTPLTIKRHRKMGPVLVLFGVAGYFAGVVLAYADGGHLVKYPMHFISGSLLASSIITTFFISRRIKGIESPWRVPHFKLGIAIISLYLVQTFLGIGIFF